jgi:GNAT superfamily N-acetyltransferase
MKIREARLQDKEIILDFVTKLSVYEKKPLTDIGMTLAKIEKHGFGERPYFYTLIAEQGNNPVGFALYYFAYSGWAGGPVLYLEDLFVEENFRQRGFGEALLIELAKLAVKHECCRMEWCVYNWNDKAIEFYKSLGAQTKTDLWQCRLAGENLLQLSKRD